MAQCQADHKKHSTSRFDLYGGIFSGQLYGTNAAGNGHVDRMQSCPSFRMSSRENFISRENSLSSFGSSFRDETGMKTAGLFKTDSLSSNGNGYGYGVNSSAGGGAGGGAGGLHYSGLSPHDRRKSTGGIMGQKTQIVSPEVSPVAAGKPGGGQVPAGSGAHPNSAPPRNLHSNHTEGTPPVHNQIRKGSSGDLSCRKFGSERFNLKSGAGAFHSDGFGFGEIIKGVGNLCDDFPTSPRGYKANAADVVETGSGGSLSSKGRSPRAESPKSIASSSSSGGSASPTVERVGSYGNILPSGAAKTNNLNSNGGSGIGSAVGSRAGYSNGGTGLAPSPTHSTPGGLKASRRSNSWDYATGGGQHKARHARSGSEAGGLFATTTNAYGLSPKGSMSMSPSGSLSSTPGHSSPQDGEGVFPAVKIPAVANGGKAGAGVRAALALGPGNSGSTNEQENRLIKNALSSMDAEVVKTAGNEQFKKGNFQIALSLYDKAIYLKPDMASLRSNRAAALTGLGRIYEAMQECLQAIRLDACYARAHHRLGTLYLRLGQVDNATKHFKLSSALDQVSADIQRCASVEKHLKRCGEARRIMDWDAVLRESDATIIAGADCAPQVIAYKAEALLKLHRPEEADSVMTNIRKCEEVLRRPSLAPINSMVQLVQAQVDMALGRFENAVSAAEKSAQSAPQNLTITAMLRNARTVARTRKLGNDLFKAGKYADAIVAYNEGLESAPQNAVLLCNRAACRAKLNHFEKAVEDSNRALETRPGYTKALLRRAHSYYMLQRWEFAMRDYEVLRRELPGDAQVAKALFDVQVALRVAKGEDTRFLKSFGGEVVEVITNDQFQQAITAPGLAVVQFGTRWSSRCKEMTPFLEDLCRRYPSLSFLKVDTDDHPYLTKVGNVTLVPTYKVYKNGSNVHVLDGPTQEELETALKYFSSRV